MIWFKTKIDAGSVCVETQEDLDAVWPQLARFSVAIIDVRLPNFDCHNGFTLAEILIQHGLKVGIASVAIERQHEHWASKMGIPTFDTLNMLVANSEEDYVFQIIARESCSNFNQLFSENKKSE